MSNVYCRLCLSRDKVVDVFSKELINSDKLRMYIWMYTGVNIVADDPITTYACHACCHICVNMYKFGKTAMANDLALKKTFLKNDAKAPSNGINDNTLKLYDFLLKKRQDVTVKLADVCDETPVAPRDPLFEKKYVVNPSIYYIMRKYPNTILPQDVLRWNCNPYVQLTNLATRKENSRENRKEDSASDKLPDEVQSFMRKKLSGISIRNIPNDDGSQQLTTTNIRKDPFNTHVLSEKKSSQKLTETRSSDGFNSTQHTPKENILVPKPHWNIVKEHVSEKKGLKRIIEKSESIGAKRKKTFEEYKVDPTLPDCDNLDPNCDINSSNTSIISENVGGLKRLSENTLENAKVAHYETATMRTRKSTPSFFADKDIFDSVDEYISQSSDNTHNMSLLQTVDEEMTFACKICNKMFNEKRKLKYHLRKDHQICIVCKLMFRSKKTLIEHLREKCYQVIIENQPILCLKKCDDMIQQTSNDSYNVCDIFEISDNDDEPPPQTRTLSETDLDGQPFNLTDYTKIKEIYYKYHKSAVLPFYKSVSCQENCDLYTSSMGKRQGIMSNMYTILKYYRVSIELRASDSMKVMIEEKKAAPEPMNQDAWKGFQIRTTKSRPAHPSNCRPTASKFPIIPNSKLISNSTLRDMSSTAPSANFETTVTYSKTTIQLPHMSTDTNQTKNICASTKQQVSQAITRQVPKPINQQVPQPIKQVPQTQSNGNVCRLLNVSANIPPVRKHLRVRMADTSLNQSTTQISQVNGNTGSSATNVTNGTDSPTSNENFKFIRVNPT